KPDHPPLSLIRTELETLIPIDTAPLPPAEPLKSPPLPNEALAPPSSHQPLIQNRGNPLDATSAPDSASVDPSSALEEPAEILTDRSDASAWSLLSGSGTSLGTGRFARSTGSLTGTTRATALLARDLSRPAIAPHLKPYVDRNFPVAAKLARAEGRATVSATIRPDGTPTDIRVVHVDPRGRGFGETCTRTLHHGPAWKPELNRDGRPVSSQVTYTCRSELPKDVGITTDAPTSGAGANRGWTKPASG